MSTKPDEMLHKKVHNLLETSTTKLTCFRPSFIVQSGNASVDTCHAHAQEFQQGPEITMWPERMELVLHVSLTMPRQHQQQSSHWHSLLEHTVRAHIQSLSICLLNSLRIPISERTVNFLCFIAHKMLL